MTFEKGSGDTWCEWNLSIPGCGRYSNLWHRRGASLGLLRATLRLLPSFLSLATTSWSLCLAIATLPGGNGVRRRMIWEGNRVTDSSSTQVIQVKLLFGLDNIFWPYACYYSTQSGMYINGYIAKQQMLSKNNTLTNQSLFNPYLLHEIRLVWLAPFQNLRGQHSHIRKQNFWTKKNSNVRVLTS